MSDYLDERKFAKQIEKNKIAILGHSFKEGVDRDYSRTGVHEKNVIEKQRECLTCERIFFSSWVGNRRCPKCSESVDFKNLAD